MVRSHTHTHDSIFCWRVCVLIECPSLARKRVHARQPSRIRVAVVGTHSHTALAQLMMVGRWDVGDGALIVLDWFAALKDVD